MSAGVDAERREEAFFAAAERARRRVLFEQQVLRYFEQGFSIRETARLLSCTKKRVELARAWLGLTRENGVSRGDAGAGEGAHD